MQKLTKIEVPQGSILNLLLYLIYVNDISNASSYTLAITNLSVSDFKKMGNLELQQLYSWCNAIKWQGNPTNV